ncbi:zinc ribbon domain-containing protein [bacterium]|nr:zinc ribbon domain-containing protein [bacterium]
MRKCAKCQTECDDGFKFCMNCGEPLSSMEQAKVTTKLDESEAADFLHKVTPFSSGLASADVAGGYGSSGSEDYSIPNIADWSDGDQPKWSSGSSSAVQAQIIKPTDSQNLENLAKDRENLPDSAVVEPVYSEQLEQVEQTPQPTPPNLQKEEDESFYSNNFANTPQSIFQNSGSKPQIQVQNGEDERSKNTRNIIGIACCSCFTLAMILIFTFFVFAIVK